VVCGYAVSLPTASPEKYMHTQTQTEPQSQFTSQKRRYLPLWIVLFLLLTALPLHAADRASDAARYLEEKGLSPLLVTAVVSMLPIFELRGGIPVGVAVLKQNPFLVYLAALAGNLIPVFPILLLLNPVRKLLEKLPLFRGIFGYLQKRAENNRQLIERYEEFGLMLFVAIPLPITGAWTGSVLAVVLGLRVVKSFLFIMFGVLTAGVIVTLLTVAGRWGLIIALLILGGFIFYYTLNIMKKRRAA
jgi:uncharacterized membrane protein